MSQNQIIKCNKRIHSWTLFTCILPSFKRSKSRQGIEALAKFKDGCDIDLNVCPAQQNLQLCVKQKILIAYHLHTITESGRKESNDFEKSVGIDLHRVKTRAKTFSMPCNSRHLREQFKFFLQN